jgi:F-type H+-transporting ATPase subunit delta
MSGKQAQAQRYAQAVLQAMLERWQAVLDELFETFSKDHETFALLMDASKDFAEREEALESALPDGTPFELVNLLKLLLQEGDLDLLSEISSALTLAASGQQAPTKADITSAMELPDDDKESLRQALIKQYGDDLVFSFHVDPSLMGGLRVRVGDRLIDTSIASRLASLRESFASAVR